MELWELQQKQSLPLEAKIAMTLRRIQEWHDYWDGNVYVSFSGGKDSTVLLHLVRQCYPDVPAVFSDTGLEFPEIREFVKNVPNVTWLRPAMTFKKVIEKHGYPVISKEQAQWIERARRGDPQVIREKLYGIRPDGSRSRFCTSAEWRRLFNAPFKISAECCNEMKKKPLRKYAHETGRVPIIGTMASESKLREKNWLKTGCNAFDAKRPVSMPMSFWLEKDVWEYLRKYQVRVTPCKEGTQMNELFANWLHSGDKGLLQLTLSRESYLFLRAEKQPGFDYLYCQRQYGSDGLRRKDSFQYAGLYCAADGLIYDADYALTHMDGADKTLPARSYDALRRQLQQDVRAMIEQRVGNDRARLEVQTLTAEKCLSALEQYRNHYAARDVRQRYLETGELDSDGFHCRYVPEGWTEDSFLSYIADPLAYAEQEAERYWSENQEEMYLQFLERDARAAEQAAIADNPQNSVHIVRQIMAVMNTSGAKTVNVTVRKDGKELTFKTETGDLRRDCTGGYSHWHMIAADRRRFFECFGRNAEYRPEEILRITYGRSILYEANG